MEKLNYYIIITCLYVGFWIGVAYESVGDVGYGKSFEWWIVPMVAIFILLPLQMGYLIGKENNNQK